MTDMEQVMVAKADEKVLFEHPTGPANIFFEARITKDGTLEVHAFNAAGGSIPVIMQQQGSRWNARLVQSGEAQLRFCPTDQADTFKIVLTMPAGSAIEGSIICKWDKAGYITTSSLAPAKDGTSASYRTLAKALNALDAEELVALCKNATERGKQGE
jgi:hypothetical protein